MRECKKAIKCHTRRKSNRKGNTLALGHFLHPSSSSSIPTSLTPETNSQPLPTIVVVPVSLADMASASALYRETSAAFTNSTPSVNTGSSSTRSRDASSIRFSPAFSDTFSFLEAASRSDFLPPASPLSSNISSDAGSSHVLSYNDARPLFDGELTQPLAQTSAGSSLTTDTALGDAGVSLENTMTTDPFSWLLLDSYLSRLEEHND